jgi:predicted Zn-dependent peptidase
VNLSGLAENFDKALELFESLLQDPKPDKEALDNLIDDILKKRADDKLSKQTILWNALYSYAQYGPKSPFTSRLTEKELRALTPEELTSLIKSITSYEHRVLYYGPLAPEALTASLDKLHRVPEKLKPVPAPVKHDEQPTGDNVYVVDYDMKQAEIILLAKVEPYNKENVPVIILFNEYFGGGMSSVVFQDMRESKALAYSVYATYSTPRRPERSHYIMAYVGTQADKLPEAMNGMSALLKAMPESETSFNAAKASVLQRLQTERITKASVLFNYESAVKMGLSHDIRKDVYEKVPGMSLQHLKDFQKRYFAGARYSVLAIGDKSKLDAGALSRYGKVRFVSLKDIFGY